MTRNCSREVLNFHREEGQDNISQGISGKLAEALEYVAWILEQDLQQRHRLDEPRVPPLLIYTDAAEEPSASGELPRIMSQRY